ncbi:MAG: hypothetical protein EOP47_23695 [Sphingobacteriaceae bacterium]|nr:MAG: hypothetical protein EOP47_23695 [Sphingobacteriaceae bacterium]
MKKLLTLLVILSALTRFSASAGDLDSLKQQLKITSDDSLRAHIYGQIAAEYMLYDTVSNKVKKLVYQNEALINSYAALHLYSKYNDTTGLRTCYDNLATVYHSQKKYSQAKWFTLQSNHLSRVINDVPNIIASLIKLAAIKTDIKDYTLAMQDLNEAQVLSNKSKAAPAKAAVQKTYAKLYTRMNKKSKATAALKRSKAITDSIRIKEAKTLAKLNPDPATAKKKYPATGKRRAPLLPAAKQVATI